MNERKTRRNDKNRQQMRPHRIDSLTWSSRLTIAMVMIAATASVSLGQDTCAEGDTCYHGARIGYVCDHACIDLKQGVPASVTCRFEIGDRDDHCDMLRVLRLKAPACQNRECSVEISTEGNAACGGDPLACDPGLDDGCDVQCVFACTLNQYTDPETGLSLVGAPQQGVVKFGITVTLNAADIATLIDEGELHPLSSVQVVVKDLCDSGAMDCSTYPVHLGFGAGANLCNRDDGDECTNDMCVGISCAHDPICTTDGDCDDDDACTQNTCLDTGCCSYPPICPDGVTCCAGGASCDDSLGCTVDTCGDNGCCEHSPLCPNGECCADGASCDDGDPCTDDTCGADGCCEHSPHCPEGVCTTSPICPPGVCCLDGVTCNDGDACTDDRCGDDGCCEISPHCPPDATCCADGTPCPYDPCATAACVNGCCEYTPICPDGTCCFDGQTCDDGDVCTIDFCGTDGCCDTQPRCPDGDCCADGSSCESSEDCVVGYCNPHTGCCKYFAECFDPVTDCPDDGDACTIPICTPDGCCDQRPRCPDFMGCCANDGECDDGNPCTREKCLPNGCCKPVPACVDPVRDCPDDGDLCTIEFCTLEGCCDQRAVSCPQDSNPCTEEVCDSATGGCISRPIIPPPDGCPILRDLETAE